MRHPQRYVHSSSTSTTGPLPLATLNNYKRLLGSSLYVSRRGGSSCRRGCEAALRCCRLLLLLAFPLLAAAVRMAVSPQTGEKSTTRTLTADKPVTAPHDYLARAIQHVAICAQQPSSRRIVLFAEYKRRAALVLVLRATRSMLSLYVYECRDRVCRCGAFVSNLCFAFTSLVETGSLGVVAALAAPGRAVHMLLGRGGGGPRSSSVSLPVLS